MMRLRTANPVEPELCQLREHDALTRYAIAHHDIERADSICGNDQHTGLTVGERNVVNVAHLALASVGERQVGLHQGGAHLHLAAVPPSAMYTEPVRKLLSSLARNSMSLAISSG